RGRGLPPACRRRRPAPGRRPRLRARPVVPAGGNGRSSCALSYTTKTRRAQKDTKRLHQTIRGFLKREDVMTTVAAVVDCLKEFAPLELAAAGDNVGLLLGDPAAPVRRLMTCLTVTPESAAEAVSSQAELIVTHHPILFRPVQRLTAADPQGQMLLALA